MNATCCWAIITLLIASGCKKIKDEARVYAQPKIINSFTLQASDNPTLSANYNGIINSDSIVIKIPKTAHIEKLVPTIDFKGASLSPASKMQKDFTQPVFYTVTANDGTTRQYKVIVRLLDDAKKLMSFEFRKANNPSLDQDIIGEIIGDSIAAPVPAKAAFESLVPTITYTGVSVSPGDQKANDFRNPAVYSVIAEDNSTHNYTVYTGYRSDVFATGDDGYLYDLNAVDGTVKWRYYVGGSGTPVCNDGVVYVLGADNVVFAIDIKTGTLKWKNNPPAGQFSLGLPVAKYGKIYFAGSGNLPTSGYYVKYAAFIYCIDAATGTTSWLQKIATGYDYQDARLTNVTVEENIACVYDIMNGIFAFSAVDGTPLWGKPGDMLGRTNPAIVNGKIYYGIEGGMACLNASDGQFQWRNIDRQVYTSPTISENVVFFSTYNEIKAFNIDGSLKWQTSYGEQQNTVSYAPTVFDNKVLSVTGKNRLLAFDCKDGRLLWERQHFNAKPVIGNNHVYIPDEAYHINCLDANGNTIWTTNFSAKFLYPFCTIDNLGNTMHATDSGAQQ